MYNRRASSYNIIRTSVYLCVKYCGGYQGVPIYIYFKLHSWVVCAQYTRFTRAFFFNVAIFLQQLKIKTFLVHRRACKLWLASALIIVSMVSSPMVTIFSPRLHSSTGILYSSQHSRCIHTVIKSAGHRWKVTNLWAMNNIFKVFNLMVIRTVGYQMTVITRVIRLFSYLFKAMYRHNNKRL